MAGNHLNEKMAEYNSVDQKGEDPEKELSVDDLTEMNQPRSVQKLKSLDPNTKKKSSFVITGVVVAKPKERVLTEECDSYDDVDETCETHTEDVSSDILDLSKNTDIEPDPSSTEDVSPNLEEPPRDPRISDMTASRFKVVKIETQEPFKRGRWTCTDFLDPPAEKVEKAERGVDEAGSGNSSAASSIHYIPGVDDPAKNPLGSATMVIAEGYHPIVEPQPILPPTASQTINVNNVNILQNGEYTPGSMVLSGQSGAFQIHDNVNMPIQGDHTPSQQPPSLATTQPGLSSQAQPIPSQSKPSTLPAPHMSSQQHEYIHAPFSEPTPSSSQPSNGHIPTLPSQAQSTNSVTAQGSLLPGQSGVAAAPGTAQEAQKPPEYVPQGQDYNINATSQDYLPHGSQEYVNDYLPTGKDFLPPQPTDFGVAATPLAKEPASKNESQPQLNINQPSLSQNDYTGASQSLPSASVTQSITPAVPPSSASTPTVGGQEYSSSGQTKPALPLAVSATASSATVSPNNEIVVVQGTDASLVTTDRGSAFHISVRGEEGAPIKSSSSAVVEPVVSEAEEEANGAAAMTLEGKTAAAMAQSILTPPLLEMVSATINAGGMHQSKEEGDERCILNVFSGASTVAIDNKIEQAMDLVKSHLMFAVREEVEVLKEQIKELLEKNSQLECENSIYKAAASPETITKVKQQQQQQQQQQQPPSSSTS